MVRKLSGAIGIRGIAHSALADGTRTREVSGPQTDSPAERQLDGAILATLRRVIPAQEVLTRGKLSPKKPN
jgi:hypothetical protein